jgi:hypothetical protein
MAIVFELGTDFLLAEDIPLDAEDLSYGLERGFLKAATVIEVATHEVSYGAGDLVLQDLADLLNDETDKITDVLGALNDPERAHDPRDSARKWLYLQLKAANNERSRLADPLGAVEEIYADFEYPPAIEPFVRYMPLRPGGQSGTEALLKRWAAFLDREHRALARR